MHGAFGDDGVRLEILKAVRNAVARIHVSIRDDQLGLALQLVVFSLVWRGKQLGTHCASRSARQRLRRHAYGHRGHVLSASLSIVFIRRLFLAFISVKGTDSKTNERSFYNIAVLGLKTIANRIKRPAHAAVDDMNTAERQRMKPFMSRSATTRCSSPKSMNRRQAGRRPQRFSGLSIDQEKVGEVKQAEMLGQQP